MKKLSSFVISVLLGGPMLLLSTCGSLFPDPSLICRSGETPIQGVDCADEAACNPETSLCEWRCIDDSACNQKENAKSACIAGFCRRCDNDPKDETRCTFSCEDNTRCESSSCDLYAPSPSNQLLGRCLPSSIAVSNDQRKVPSSLPGILYVKNSPIDGCSDELKITGTLSNPFCNIDRALSELTRRFSGQKLGIIRVMGSAMPYELAQLRNVADLPPHVLILGDPPKDLDDPLKDTGIFSKISQGVSLIQSVTQISDFTLTFSGFVFANSAVNLKCENQSEASKISLQILNSEIRHSTIQAISSTNCNIYLDRLIIRENEISSNSVSPQELVRIESKSKQEITLKMTNSIIVANKNNNKMPLFNLLGVSAYLSYNTIANNESVAIPQQPIFYCEAQPAGEISASIIFNNNYHNLTNCHLKDTTIQPDAGQPWTEKSSSVATYIQRIIPSCADREQPPQLPPDDLILRDTRCWDISGKARPCQTQTNMSGIRLCPGASYPD